ncbi:MAG: hypothetical protein FJ271_24145 [Planctomycetes bacterium]|nr:hypothetical protein [Planctomycetota bacterium]
MASDVQIANRALVKLGEKTIVSLTEDSNPARAINECYVLVRRNEIRRHPWHFAKKRAKLAVSVTAPEFDFLYAYPLPADCLRVLMPHPQSNSVQYDGKVDWKIEGRNILSNEAGPLKITYLADITDPEQFDASFVDTFAARLAAEVAHRLTGSVDKRKMAFEEYRMSLFEARQTNAFEQFSIERVRDDWEIARL